MMTSFNCMLHATFVLGLLARVATGYTALGRAGAAAVLVVNTVYIHGGITSTLGPAANDLLILPVDQSFNLTSPPWGTGSGSFLNSPTLSGHTAFIGGYNNSLFYVFGGVYAQGNSIADSNTLWSFNTTTTTFSGKLNIAGLNPDPVDSHTAVSRTQDGSSWIFGGQNTTSTPNTLFNTTWRLLTTPSLAWSPVGGVAPGGGRFGHSANIMSDGRMVLLGGKGAKGELFLMSQVPVFDTNSGAWTLLIAQLRKGLPVPRLDHVSVITHDNKIIIHGGNNGNQTTLGDIGVLDMVAAIPAWSIPQTNGTAPSARMGHSAVMVGTTCFIFFGKLTNATLDNGVYALDTTTFVWLTTYTPNHLEYTKTWLLPSSVSIPDPVASPCNVTAGSCNSNDDNMVPMGVVIGIAVGSAVLLAVVLVTAFIYYRRYRNSQSDVHTTIEPDLNHYDEPYRRSYEIAEIDSGPGNWFFQPDFPDLPHPLPSQPNARPWSAIPLSSPMRISSQDAGQFPRSFSLDSSTIVQPSYRAPARRRPTSGLYQPPQMLRTPPEQDITDERPFLRSTRASIIVPATRGSIDVPGSWRHGSDIPLEEAVNEEARMESTPLDVGSVREEVGASAGEMVEVGEVEVGNEELRRSRSVHKPNSRNG